MIEVKNESWAVRWIVTALCFAPGLLVPGVGWTQEAGAASTTEQTEDDDRTSLIPIPVLFYQPETGVGFGASAVYLFPLGRAEQTETRAFPSAISAIAIYTTKKQIITALSTELYPASGRYRFSGELSYSKFPTKLWGIGNETPESLEEDYTPVTFNVMLEGQRRLARGWFAGLTGQVAYRELKEVEEGGLIESGSLPGSKDGWLSGAGLLLIWDTRESTWYPRSSSFHQLRAMLYDGAFGSDFDYFSLSVDFRKYTSLFSEHVLALRALGAGMSGDPPFDLLPQLGGDMLLRGYYQGRFRDKNLVALQAEYRAPLWWKLGGVAFASTGQVAAKPGDFRFDSFHSAAGFGVRFLVQDEEGVQLRADLAWGFDGDASGFYINIGEAF